VLCKTAWVCVLMSMRWPVHACRDADREAGILRRPPVATAHGAELLQVGARAAALRTRPVRSVCSDTINVADSPIDL